MQETIRAAVAHGLEKLGATGVPFVIEWPSDSSHGDFATNAAMAASKQLGKPPREVAEALIPHLREALGNDAKAVEIAGPGFINVMLSREAIAHVLDEAQHSNSWGKHTDGAGKRVMIEYSCPNPFKEMHIGHLLSTVIGESVSRLVEASGASVLRDSYGGDVGPHVAKALWALREKEISEPSTSREIGHAYEQGAHAYEASDNARAEIDAINVALYEALAKGEAERTEDERQLLEVWRKGRDAALAAFREIYRILDTSFDYYFFESEVTPAAMRVVGDGLSQGVFEKSDGAIIYPGEKKGLHTLVFITSRGTPTYEAKDIGLAFHKEERVETDQIIIETGAEQIGHFKVFLAALAEIAPAIAAKMTHISHGLLTLTTGKMSSRKGNVLLARELLQELIEKAAQKNADPLIAEQVAVGALKYMILRSAPGANIIFDPEQSLSLEGDSGPYLQYAYVRAKAIIEKVENAAGDMPEGMPAVSSAPAAPEEPYLIERLLIRFPDIIRRAQAEYAPQQVAHYLTQLAGEWNSFYARERIIGDEHEAYKLRIARAFVCTMQNGLWVLGMPTPEKM